MRRDVETRSIVVDEQRVEHLHPVHLDLALLLGAMLLVPTGSALGRRAWAARGERRRALRVGAAAGAIALAVAAFSVDHVPDPPEMAPAKAAGLPRLIPLGTERERDGQTTLITRKFRREVPTRRLIHVHAYSLTVIANELPLLLVGGWGLGLIFARRRRGRTAHRDVARGLAAGEGERSSRLMQ